MTVNTTEAPTRIATGRSTKPVKGEKAGSGPASGDTAAAKKKAMRRKLIILGALLVIVGGAAKFTILAPPAGKVAAKPAPGPVLAMPEMTLNLTAGHFLRLKLAVQTTKGTSTEFDTSEGAQAVIAQFSDHSVAELTGNPARTKAKAELLKRLQDIYPKRILDLYYTDFVMQ
jgi:flagellar FliL protein